MPCLDNGPSYGSDGDGVAVKHLCRVMRDLKQYPEVRRAILKRHGNLRDWVREHERRDLERLRDKRESLDRKRARATAMQKLTPAEQRALGL